jgi:hypothetical protein
VSKFAPDTVRTNAGPPEVAAFGLKLVSTGARSGAELIIKVNPFEVLPLVPFRTVTVARPVEAMSDARIVAVSWPEEMKVVARLAPFHLTTEVLLKFSPFSLSMNAGPPAAAESGIIPVRVGAAAGPTVMVNGNPFDEPSPGPGLKAVMVATPGWAMSEAVIAAPN